MKRVNIAKSMYWLYTFIFIFVMINREFLFLGIDLRYILLILGIFLIFYRLGNRNKGQFKIENEKKNNDFIGVFILYVWCFISNIAWLWNGLNINNEKFMGQIILLINNFIGIIVFYLYRKYFKEEYINKIIIFSCCILMLSFILISAGFELHEISGSDVRALVKASEIAEDHKNLYGGSYRLAGYAEDPNYASFFWMIGIVATLQSKISRKYKLMFSVCFIISFGFSCSKTILISFFVGFLYITIQKLLLKYGYKKIINFFIVISIIGVCFILPKTNLLTSMSTMRTRFMMWNMANTIFEESPIMGNGIDSFKSYINLQYNGGWYVQPHSTYWQLLSETGIIGLLIFAILMYSRLNNAKNKYSNFLIFIYFMFAINFETIQLQFFVYIMYLISLNEDWRKNEKEKGVICS